MSDQHFKEPRLDRPVTLSYDVLLSPRYRALTPTARDVYTIFLYKRVFMKKKKNKPSKLKNNCELQFSEKEAVDKWGISRSAFRRAIKQLISLEIIAITHKGYGSNHDVNLYELLGKFDGIVKF